MILNFLRNLITGLAVLGIVTVYGYIAYLYFHYGIEDYTEYFKEINQD